LADGFGVFGPEGKGSGLFCTLSGGVPVRLFNQATMDFTSSSPRSFAS
jgi:hypothetical protein